MKHWQLKTIVILALLFFVASVAIQTAVSLGYFFTSEEENPTVRAINTEQLPIIAVNFSKDVAAISNKVFGEGVEMPFLDNIWDKNVGFDQNTLNVAKAIKFTNLRFGGATCRTYNWKDEAMTGFRPYQKVYWEGIDQWYQYAKLLDLPAPTICTNIHLSPQDSADWVRYANIEKKYDIINWEMGNEEYLAYTKVEDYLRDAKAHCTAMKAVDPRIKCGVVGDEKAVSWTNAKLLSLLKPGDFDFFVAHFYEPEGYFNYYSLYMNSDKYEKKVKLKPGKYRFTFQAIGDQAPETKDPVPTVQVCFDKDCSWVDVTNTERGKWVEYSTREYDIKEGMHALSFHLADDYYGWTSRQDKNIFVANVKLTSNNSETMNLEFVDTKTWTYSFLASNLSTEDTIKGIRTLMQQRGLDMPIFITEYGWSYGTEAYPNWGLQYDWRSTLFDVLHIQSLIKEAIPQANIWKDLSTGYWKYFSDDIKGQNYWPIFSVFKLLSEKTGDILVETRIENVPTYNAQKLKTLSRENIPYLSIISSKKGDKRYINVVNRSLDSAITATIRTNLRYDSVKVSEIAPSSIEAHPYRDDQFKESITTEERVLAVSGDFNYSFKPFSVTTFEFDGALLNVGTSHPAAVLAGYKAPAPKGLPAVKPGECAVWPDGGNHFNGLTVTLACGKGVTAASYQWDKGPVFGFNGNASTWFSADKKRTLNISYRYQANVKGKLVEKTARTSKIFDANQRYCNIVPGGGSFTKDMDIEIECGRGVKRSTWRWGNGPAYNFSPSTKIKFVADFSKSLNLSFAYDQMNGGRIEEKVVKFSKNFKVPQCIDSDKGQNYRLRGTLAYTGNTIKRTYADYCSGSTLFEYYCDRNDYMAFAKIKCPGGCSNGSCASATNIN